MEEELRIVIKKIPTKMTESEMTSILNKSIKGEYFNFQYVKPPYKYDIKNNNLCFITIKSIDTRIKLEDFLASYEIINKKGQKQKLECDLCLIQPKSDIPVIDDSKINNTFADLDHFKQFKEAFQADDLLKFKLDQTQCKYFKII